MRQKLLPSAAGAETYAAARRSGGTRMLGSAPPPGSASGGVQAGFVLPVAANETEPDTAVTAVVASATAPAKARAERTRARKENLRGERVTRWLRKGSTP